MDVWKSRFPILRHRFWKLDVETPYPNVWVFLEAWALDIQVPVADASQCSVSATL